MKKNFFKLFSFITTASIAIASMASISASAATVDTQDVPYGTTYQQYATFAGSYQYVNEIAVVYHINLELSAPTYNHVIVKYQEEKVTLRNGNGNNMPQIRATAENSYHVLTSTPSYSGTTYTHKGIYEYKVDSSNHPYGVSNTTWSRTIY